MANSRLGSLSSEDGLSWLQSVVNYVKDTQANLLYLRSADEEFFKTAGVDLKQILDSLVVSEITELDFGGVKITEKVHELKKVLPKTKIESLTLPYGLNADDISSLTTVLEDTQINKLVVWIDESALRENSLDEFFTHLTNYHLGSLTINSTKKGVEIGAVLFQKLPSTQITQLTLWGLKQTIDEHQLIESMSNLQFSALTCLELQDASLGDSAAKAIGAVLGNTKLEKLNLRHNNISDAGVDFLVPGLVLSKITHLDLEMNKINGENTLGESLKNTKIAYLFLSDNCFSINNKLFAVPDFLKSSELVLLDLEKCCSSHKTASLPTPVLPVAFIKELRFSKLTYLNLGANKLTLEHVSALADILGHSKLTHVELSGNKFSGECYSILGDGVKQSKLKYADLSNTTELPESARGLALFFEKTQGSTLGFVNLAQNSVWPEFAVIAPALANTTFLGLNLDSNRMPSPSTNTRSLAQQLKGTNIAVLNLDRNDIGDDGAAILAECLEETQIIKLSLKANSIKSPGAKALASALKKTKLRSLDVYRNEIEDDGLESLAEHAANTCITSLDVSRNPGRRGLLVDGAMWENRKKVQQFADLLKRTPTGKSCVLDFDHDFNDDQSDASLFVENCLKICRFVSEAPFIVGAIEQGNLISELKKHEHPGVYILKMFSGNDLVRVEDYALIYKKIMEQPSPVQHAAGQNEDGAYFKRQALWFILEHLPTKLASVSNHATTVFTGFKKD